MYGHCTTFSLMGLAVVGCLSLGYAGEPPELSIHELQSNTVDGDESVYDGVVVHCTGGVVVGKYEGGKPRIILQEPNDRGGWGGIQVKDWTTGLDLFSNVEPGDCVELTHVLVEESWGTTMLHWRKPDEPESGFNVTATELPLPPPILVPVSSIPAPVEGPPGEWYVENHDAELYESTRIVVRDVTVTEWGLGSHADNYNLQAPHGNDCWVADYMNEGAGSSDYHPFVILGQHFCAVAGLFEQYTYVPSGWDYYQLVTMRTVDLAICGDGDSNGDVDLQDLPRFVECLSGPLCNDEPGGCDPPSWTLAPMELSVQHCLMMDLDYDGDVDLHDFAGLQGAFGEQ